MLLYGGITSVYLDTLEWYICLWEITLSIPLPVAPDQQLKFHVIVVAEIHRWNQNEFVCRITTHRHIEIMLLFHMINGEAFMYSV